LVQEVKVQLDLIVSAQSSHPEPVCYSANKGEALREGLSAAQKLAVFIPSPLGCGDLQAVLLELQLFELY